MQFESAETLGEVHAEARRALERHFFRELAELQRVPKPKANAESPQRDHVHNTAYSRVKWHRFI